MPADNRLVPHAAQLGDLLERTLPAGVGYALVLFDLKNNDMASASNAERWKQPAILRAAANSIEIQHPESPIAIPEFNTKLWKG